MTGRKLVVEQCGLSVLRRCRARRGAPVPIEARIFSNNNLQRQLLKTIFAESRLRQIDERIEKEIGVLNVRIAELVRRGDGRICPEALDLGILRDDLAGARETLEDLGQLSPREKAALAKIGVRESDLSILTQVGVPKPPPQLQRQPAADEGQQEQGRDPEAGAAAGPGDGDALLNVFALVQQRAEGSGAPPTPRVTYRPTIAPRPMQPRPSTPTPPPVPPPPAPVPQPPPRQQGEPDVLAALAVLSEPLPAPPAAAKPPAPPPAPRPAAAPTAGAAAPVSSGELYGDELPGDFGSTLPSPVRRVRGRNPSLTKLAAEASAGGSTAAKPGSGSRDGWADWIEGSLEAKLLAAGVPRDKAGLSGAHGHASGPPVFRCLIYPLSRGCRCTK